MSTPTARFFEFGNFKIDAVERVLLRHDQPVILTQKVFDLLLLLVRNGGHVVEKETLMREVWPDTFVEEGNLTQNISVLRKALADDGHQYIQTVPRRGYRFVGPVKELTDETFVEQRIPAPPVIEADRPDRITTRGTVGSHESKWKRRALIGGGAFGVLAAAIFFSILRARNFAWHDALGFDVTNVRQRTITGPSTISYAVISSDGRRFAYSYKDKSQSRTRVVVRSINGNSAPSYFDIEPSYFLRRTPDGQNLAYALSSC